MMERVFTDSDIDAIINEQRAYLCTQHQFSPEQVEELIAGSRAALEKMMRVKV